MDKEKYLYELNKAIIHCSSIEYYYPHYFNCEDDIEFFFDEITDYEYVEYNELRQPIFKIDSFRRSFDCKLMNIII
jgi:hypothetical protein